MSEIEGWETLVKTSGDQTIAGIKNFSGNVGIGTATPGAKLTIADNGSPMGARFLDIGDDVYLTDIDLSNTLGIYGIQDITRSRLKLGSTGGIISGYNNNIGINQALPAYRLDVNGTGRFTGAVIVGDPTLDSHAATKEYVDVAVSNTPSSWTVSGSDIYRPSGNVGIGTTTPEAKLDIVAPANSGAGNELRICKNGTCCPIWKDCDGDGRTYGNGDCDESCPTCYVGSSANLFSPDGKDQDCDGTVDEYIARNKYICGLSDYCMPADEAACLNRCISLYGPLAVANLGEEYGNCYPGSWAGDGTWWKGLNSTWGTATCYSYCNCAYNEYY